MYKVEGKTVLPSTCKDLLDILNKNARFDLSVRSTCIIYDAI